MDVDFTAKSYKLHFLLEPNGTLAGDNGVLRYVYYAVHFSMEWSKIEQTMHISGRNSNQLN
jgi:hypothetical protein